MKKKLIFVTSETVSNLKLKFKQIASVIKDAPFTIPF